LKLNPIKKIVGTGLGTGYSPVAPGTAGSAAAYAIYLIPGFADYYIMIPLIAICVLAGVLIGTEFEKYHGKDPSIFTLDEFIGSWIALLFLPENIYMIISSFFIWRILDILKPFPANRFENIGGGWGIILDDIMSGFYSLLIMIAVGKIIF